MDKLTIVGRERHWNAIRIQIMNDTHSPQGLTAALLLINEFYQKFKSMKGTPPMKASLLKYYSEQEIVVNRTTPKHDTIHNSIPSLDS